MIKWWSDVDCIKLSYVINTSIIYFDHVFVYLYSFRNVITHTLCVICVWILWWSQTLCLWEQMTRWMTLKNLVLDEVVTQCSDRMWHWRWIFILIAWCYFILFYLTDLTKKNLKILTALFWIEYVFNKSCLVIVKWMWTFYPHEFVDQYFYIFYLFICIGFCFE